MSRIIDNVIAIRMLYLLVKPFVESEAYKLGIIDDKGKNLIKTKDFTTQEQRDAYTYLHRLVFNLKKLLLRLPGGDSKLKNIVAAYFLLKEAYVKNETLINEEKLLHVVNMIDEGVIFAEEQLMIEMFLAEEGEGASSPSTNVTGPNVSTDTVVPKKSDIAKYRMRKKENQEKQAAINFAKRNAGPSSTTQSSYNNSSN